jgi:hypothetical protein
VAEQYNYEYGKPTLKHSRGQRPAQSTNTKPNTNEEKLNDSFEKNCPKIIDKNQSL